MWLWTNSPGSRINTTRPNEGLLMQELHCLGLEIIGQQKHANPFHKQAGYNKYWKCLFGASPSICMRVWLLIIADGLLLQEVELQHFLGALYLLKKYPYKNAGAAIANSVDE